MTVIGLVDPGNQLEERALAGSVASHQADRFPAPDAQADRLQDFEPFVRNRTKQIKGVLPDGAPPHGGNRERLAHVLNLDRDVGMRRHHRCSATPGPKRLNRSAPIASIVSDSMNSRTCARAVTAAASISTLRENW